MNKGISVATAVLLLAGSLSIRAQTTDGYHIIQVFPVVVDTASFVQKFNFTTTNGLPVTVRAKFFPGDGTAQAATGPVTCNDTYVTSGFNGVSVASLRALCPMLVPGSAFGFLYLQAADSSDGMYVDIPVFAAYSRVSNPQGNGFSVESFAAHTFSSASTWVTGVRRLAATPSSPAFQTNCFIANMNEVAPTGAPVAKNVEYRIRTSPSTTYTATVSLLPGQFVRLLDIFASLGMPAGDYDNLGVNFRTTTLGNTDRPGILSFCTVQDNTSFGADFRIAKVGFGEFGIASNDGMAAREFAATQDAQGRKFEIGPGNSANTHVVYLKHPDVVNCVLLDLITFALLTPASGLEMRMIEGAETWGGNNAVGTGIVHLGDKKAHQGRNTRYLIEVESNESNAGATRGYGLGCGSGSGNTFGYDLIKYQEAIDRF